MPKCTFCGGAILEHRGKIFVKITGQVMHFCNSKCQKNFAKGRSAKKLKWTEESRIARGKSEK
jgi:large subunit ribosomal protein L24e